MQYLYISKDTIWDIHDMVLKIDTLSMDLLPGEIMSRNMSVLFPVLSEEEYFLIIRSNILCDEIEDSNMGVSQSLKVSYNDFFVGEPLLDSISDNQNIYYKLSVPDSLVGQSMIIILEEDSSMSNSEFFLSFDTIPTINQHDFKANSVDGQKKIIIPGLQKGSYYLNVQGRVNSDQPEQIRLYTEIPPFEIADINPIQGGNTGTVTLEVNGAQFDTLMTIYLVKEDLTIPSEDVFFVDRSTLFVRFDLAGKQLGKYELILEKSSGSKINLKDKFEIVPGTPPDLVTSFSSSSASRIGWTETINLTYKNNGNIDITEYIAVFESVGNSPIAFNLKGLDQNQNKLYFLLQQPKSPYGILRPGDEYTIQVFTKILEQFKLNLSFIK